ncbi:AER046Wp [Eremothecium gossypii ATCC 10895]|uniref:DNA repair protein RAD59 n=1 Tax=Eremothecium gossypii (strain ATCC 10895 / CBS 109.51 / FGSC 9923 / NRRL Y-1056) TaxID=284811 RepID=RAD59_EREGS|nr:AER046Wp [Eremothecium gossypii ATCC 10895]Q757G7.1 RecName: Full=DNA repair protein RAD59 [Eremothecium gossypii ATCC 10895]AAS52730.1 AER046Wp [Eremothecium gossypii ATCC 10895]AEY97036.1 FAER046Wp [Eremothecium gossypii FDAG1]
MSDYTNVSWDNVTYYGGNGVALDELELKVSWHNRPASSWSVRRIGALQHKIEQYTFKIYHVNRYGKHSLSQVIPTHVLIQFANEAFGYNGWSSAVEEVLITDVKQRERVRDGAAIELYTVTAEARVKLTLQDGTNTEATGLSKITLPSKGDAYGKAKKEASADALKRCLLSFEGIVIEHEQKVASNYYTDGEFGSRKAGDKRDR